MTAIKSLKLNPKDYANNPYSTGGFSETKRYVNTLAKTVYIRHRNNLLVTIYSTTPTLGESPELRVTLSYEGTRCSVNFNDDGILNDFGKNTPERETLLGRLTNRLNNYNSGITWVDYALSMEDLNANGGTIYLSDLDVLVSVVNDPRQVPLHPHSHECAVSEMAEPDSIRFLLIDNTGTMPTRYLSVFGNIISLTPKTNPALSNGLHVHYSFPRYTGTGHLLDDHVLVPVADLEADHEYTSFCTINELNVHLKKKDRALKVSENELEIIGNKGELESQKLKNEMELLRIKQEQQTLVQTMALSEARAKQAEEAATLARKELEQSRKDYYERRSYERRDDSEFLKYALLIGGALFAILKR